jgi:hypothetical protein
MRAAFCYRGWRKRVSRTAKKGVPMKKPLLVGLGVLIAFAGAVFTLQGLGYVKGSAMTGATGWAVLGPLIALAGLAIAAVGLRGKVR